MTVMALVVAVTMSAGPQGNTGFPIEAATSWTGGQAHFSLGITQIAPPPPGPGAGASMQLTDKLLHMSICANLAFGSATLARAFGLSEKWALVIGAATAMGAGVIKEVMDMNGGGTAEWADIGADMLGTAAGLSVTLISGRF